MPKPQELRDLPVEQIEPNLAQPRRYFDEGALEALASSVGERGVLQPVLVRPLEDGKYQLVAGERRWRAAKLAGLQTIPALMGRGHVTVWNLVHLLELPEEVLELLERGALSKSHGTALLVAKDPQVRPRLASAAIDEGWSMAKLEARARASNSADSVPNSPGSIPKGVAPAPQQEEQEHDPDAVAMNVARVWGDLLGVEVSVRTLRTRKLRLEVEFTSAEAALALGGHLGEAVARGSKRR